MASGTWLESASAQKMPDRGSDAGRQHQREWGLHDSCALGQRRSDSGRGTGVHGLRATAPTNALENDETRDDLPYVPEAARILIAKAQPCAELVGPVTVRRRRLPLKR